MLNKLLSIFVSTNAIGKVTMLITTLVKKKVMNSIRILTSWISAQNVTTYFIIDPNHQTKWKGWEPPLPPREKR